MKNYYSFAGMQRVGNHAIVNWWMKHFSSWSVRNNILGLRYNDPAAQTTDIGSDNVVQIDTWENYDPNDIIVCRLSEPIIVIIRDPYNWWASWFQYTIPNQNIQAIDRDKTIDWYIRYVEYARNTKRWISFNNWFADTDYRRSLERQYGLQESDAGLQELMRSNNEFIGNGSTFDRTRYHKNAQHMKVLTRYQKFLADDKYLTPLRQHLELADIARELFNMEPPKGIY
jgi:hypothetical protein